MRLRSMVFHASAVALVLAASFAHADTLVVSNRGDNSVQVFDTKTREQLVRVDAGVGAHEFAISPDGDMLVGSCYGSGHQHQTPDKRLVVIDLRTPEKPALIDLGDNPRPNDIRFLPGGRSVLVTSEVRQRLLEVDLDKKSVARSIDFGETTGHMLALSPDASRAYVPCVMSGKVMIIDLIKGETVGTVETAFGAEGVDISPDGSRLWVACNRSDSIAIVDATERKLVRMIQTDGFPFRVRFTPDGAKVVISHPGTSDVRVYDAATGDEKSRVELAGGQPTSIVVSSDSGRAYVVCGPLSKIAEIDLRESRVSHWFETGPVPDALAVTSHPFKRADG